MMPPRARDRGIEGEDEMTEEKNENESEMKFYP